MAMKKWGGGGGGTLDHTKQTNICNGALQLQL